MLDEKTLKEKIIDVGAYYSAQQVEVNPDELLEHEFTEEEVEFLRGKEISYVEDIMREEYKPLTDLSDKEVQAIKDGLKEYSPYALVNDWSLGICDFDYDMVMGDYLFNKRKEIGNLMGHHHELYGRLYLAILNIKSELEGWHQPLSMIRYV